MGAEKRRALKGAIVYCFLAESRIALAMKKGGNELEVHVSAGQELLFGV